MTAWRRFFIIRSPARGRVLLLLLALLAGRPLVAASIPQAASARAGAEAAPRLLDVFPAPDAVDVARDAALVLTFSEPVALGAEAVDLQCEGSGPHALEVTGDGVVFTLRPTAPLWPAERCAVTVLAAAVTDLDTDDPPDLMTADTTWSFTTGRGPAQPVVINELDVVTAVAGDALIELYDGGAGGTDLGGLALVLYRDDATTAVAFDLAGYTTDSAGFFVAGGSGIDGASLILADGRLPDGPAAVALYAGAAADFPEGAPATTDQLLDAAVYSEGETPAPALLAMLEADELPLDEARRGAAEIDSVGRCPDGAGGQRRTGSFRPGRPTPGEPNDCRPDDAPRVLAAAPPNGDTAVDPAATVTITFSEPVDFEDGAVEIQCAAGGRLGFTLAGDGLDYTLVPTPPFQPADTCAVTIRGEQVHDRDADDPPDVMAADTTWGFSIRRPPAGFVLINEVDAETPGAEPAEFIELYDGGAGSTALDGLALVLFDGLTDLSYRAIDLDGYATDSAGYFLIGGSAVDGAGIVLPDGWLQNGPDAAGLFAADGQAWPDGSPLPAVEPLDALVYGRGDEPATGLRALLNPGQPQADENGRGDAGHHSNQRCPNGGGGARNTSGYRQNGPTPGEANDCITDGAPRIARVAPIDGAIGVKVDAELGIEFDEAVTLSDSWLAIECTTSGGHAYAVELDSAVVDVRPVVPFTKGERCVATILAGKVSDQDAEDPPDVMAADYTWGFEIEAPVADFIVINEIDADTSGRDDREFIEFYDGGLGETSLDGLVLVFFNGSSLAAYRTIDLSGLATDERGYVLLGNPALQPGLEFPDGTLQNGPDAVAVYAGSPASFPAGSPVSVDGLVDAVVYGEPAATSPALLALLGPGQAAANENARGARDEHSLQRCPNGAGGQRRTAPFLPNPPTPRAPSDCQTDTAPFVLSTVPAGGAVGVARYADLTVNFSEPVLLSPDWVQVTCSPSGAHAVQVSGGPSSYWLESREPFSPADRCLAQVRAEAVQDTDQDDPPDRMAADFEWRFEVVPQVVDFVVINEIDADTPGADTAEFIELYDGGRGGTDLSGLVVALYNGNGDQVYRTIDLQGRKTDGGGYFVIGNGEVLDRHMALPDGSLQNGPDAVALFEREVSALPNGAGIITRGLVDALVYGTSDSPDPELLALLNPGQPQADEDGRGAGPAHSLQRCPNGGGGRRNTVPFLPNRPTAGRANDCAIDAAPGVESVVPPAGSSGVAVEAELAITFDEAVRVDAGWASLDCPTGGHQELNESGGPRAFRLHLAAPLGPGETCTASVRAARVHDLDENDPPDTMVADYVWQFTTTAAPVADFILINEIDADTPGADTAEFVELYDGGVGNTSLAGLVLVFGNGRDDAVYRALDLAPYRTDARGYFVAGNRDINSAGLTFGNGTLQNGPDAVALYRGRAADFPNGARLTGRSLIDAVVYGPAGQPDAGLLALLNPGQPQADEDGRGAAETDALGRCPNGGGGQRTTAAYRPGPPSPGAANPCLADDAPFVAAVLPEDGSAAVPVDSPLGVTFSEDVAVDEGWLALDCATGSRDLAISGGPRTFTAVPTSPLVYDEQCTVTVSAGRVHDLDRDDPPDQMAADFRWRFTTAAPPPPDLSAAFSHNGPLWIGQAAVFTNTSTGPAPLAFRWDFGDGSPPGTETHPRHTYARPGHYLVTLTARHDSNEASARATVEVMPRQVYLPVFNVTGPTSGRTAVFLPLVAGR